MKPAVKLNHNVNKTGAVDKYFWKFSIKFYFISFNKVRSQNLQKITFLNYFKGKVWMFLMVIFNNMNGTKLIKSFKFSY